MTLLTDFGGRDAYVGIMKGVLYARAPELRAVVDLTHEVPPQDVAAASFHLAHAWRFFPAGTVHVAVVDPGVGSERPILVARSGGHAFLAPDNGLLGPVLEQDAGDVEVRRLDVERFSLDRRSRTFHGRDVFAPAAASLAAGLDPAEAGAPADAWERGVFPRPSVSAGAAAGVVISVDHFGNLVTNLGREHLHDLGGDSRGAALEAAGRRIPLLGTYAEARPGELLALVDSYDLLEISVREGSAAAALGLGVGAPVQLVREP